MAGLWRQVEDESTKFTYKFDLGFEDKKSRITQGYKYMT